MQHIPFVLACIYFSHLEVVYAITISLSLSLAPSAAPTNLQLTPSGNNMVTVTWGPSSGASRYVVRYNQDEVTVEDVEQAILTGLEAGVEYSVTVQGFGDLPGNVSSSETITLQGKD